MRQIVTQEDTIALKDLRPVSEDLPIPVWMHTDAVDPPCMRINPEDTCNADPTITAVWWDVTLVLLFGIEVGVLLFL